MTAAGRRVVVAMSGGVDSSVAAALLRRGGWQVIGVFMRLGTPPGIAGAAEAHDACSPRRGCCSARDAADARRVAEALDIPLYVLNFEDEFSRIIDRFAEEYNRGRTPNPCILCNNWLKFGRLAAYARAAGADCIATGHYARIGRDPDTDRPLLMRAADARKDQSYVLFGLPVNLLGQLILPVGDLTKDRVRAIALELSLPVHDKPDSQEICFVPDGDYAALLERRRPGTLRPGEIVDTAGRVIGTHQGHQRFTIGQRKGLRLAMGRPMYVVGIDAERNRVVLGERRDLLRTHLAADGANWLTGPAPAAGATFRCHARIRYNHTPAPAVARITGEQTFEVVFDEPQSAVTPGQAVVLYDGDVVLGGGWICR